MGTEGAGLQQAVIAPSGGGNIGGPKTGNPETRACDLEQTATLATNGLLQTLPPEELQRIKGLCRWRQLATNEMVFDQDDPSQDVFFIVSGKLRIVVFRKQSEKGAAGSAMLAESADLLRDTSASPFELQQQDDSEAEAESIKAGMAAFEERMEEGAPMTLTELGAGDTFGELSAIDGYMRSARAVALEPSLVAIMDGATFMEVVHRHGDLAVALLRRFAGYLRTSNRRMYNLSTLTAKQRIYAQLARLAEVNPHRPAEWVIDPLPSHVDIAFWAGTKRETVAAAIGWLAREGIVARQHRVLVVRDPVRLRALSDG